VTLGGSVPLAGRREWLGLAVLCLPTMLVMLDLNVVILALPHLTEGLSANVTQGLWITDIYGFLIAGFLVTMGRLGDRIGYRRLLLTGATAFGALSVVAAYSSSAEMLIVVRALLGVAGATVMPSILALIKNMFPNPKQMGAAMGVWSTALVVGIAGGPTLGGALLNSFWWGSIFLIAVPVTVLLLVTGPFLLPASQPSGSGRLDLVSVGLSLAAILPVIYGLKELARSGWALVPVVVLLVGLVIGVGFVRRQRRLADPLLDLGLFAIPALGGALTINLLAGAILGGNGLLMTLHLQLVEGLSPLATALWLLLPSVIVVFGIQVAMQLTKKNRPASVLLGGSAIAAVGMLVLTQLEPVGGLAVLMIGVCIVFAGVSPVNMLSNHLVMASAPPDKAGSAGSLSTTSGELGTALGIAGIGSLATVFYQGHLNIPAQIPPDQAQAATDGIANAATAALQLSPALAQDLITATRDAFTNAYTNVAVVCVGLFIALGIIIYTTLRHIPAFGAPQPQEPTPAEHDTQTITT
jgi:MFS transporter, DHA2 family, multidrug resistance protein